jgi:cytoskeleton protein RodZ
VPSTVFELCTLRHLCPGGAAALRHTRGLTLFRTQSYHSERAAAQPGGGDEVMPSFGENLRREREMRGVTLEEMCDTTKISVRLLRALEQDQFSELPGGVFTRSFIRAYAQYLGLDEEHVLSEYKRAAQPSSDNDLSRLTPTRLLSEHRPRARVLPWVTVAVLLGSGYAVYRYSRRPFDAAYSARTSSTPSAPEVSAAPPHGSGPAPSTSQPADSGATVATSQPQNAAPPAGTSPAASGANAGVQSGVGPNPTSAQDATSATTPGTSSPTDSSNVQSPEVSTLGEGDLVLQVTTSEEAWVAVSADGKTLMQHLLPPHSTRTFRAKDSFDVTTGNAQGTILTFNGTAQKSLGREGEFRRVHLARSEPPSLAPKAPQPR